jgi:outer membrane immunogenic protein
MLRRILLASAGAMALAAMAQAAEPLPPPPPPPPPPIWTGFYAGLNVGGSWLSNTGTNVSTFNVFDNPAVHVDGEGPGSAISQTGVASVGNASGVIAGGQIGWNYQFANSWLVGIETDFQGLGVRGNGSFTRQAAEAFDIDVPPDDQARATVSTQQTVDWLGTVRGRLGWLLTPTFLIFGDGGFAYGRVTSNTLVQSIWTFPILDVMNEQWVPGFGSFADTRGGWTAGGGAEWMFLPNWSLKVEYLYYDLSSVRYNLNTASINFAVPSLETFNRSQISTRFNGNIVRAGLNYHFYTAPPPIVAKY